MTTMKRHVTKTGPNAGRLVPCTAKNCRNGGDHYEDISVQAVRSWKENSSGENVPLKTLQQSDMKSFEALPLETQNEWKSEAVSRFSSARPVGTFGEAVSYSSAEKRAAYYVYESALATLKYGSDINDDEYDAKDQQRMNAMFLNTLHEYPNSPLGPAVKDLVLKTSELPNSGRGNLIRNQAMLKIINHFQDVNRGLVVGSTEAKYELGRAEFAEQHANKAEARTDQHKTELEARLAARRNETQSPVVETSRKPEPEQEESKTLGSRLRGIFSR